MLVYLYLLKLPILLITILYKIVIIFNITIKWNHMQNDIKEIKKDLIENCDQRDRKLQNNYNINNILRLSVENFL